MIVGKVIAVCFVALIFAFAMYVAAQFDRMKNLFVPKNESVGWKFKMPKFHLLRWFKLTFWHGGWQGGYAEGYEAGFAVASEGSGNMYPKELTDMMGTRPLDCSDRDRMEIIGLNRRITDLTVQCEWQEKKLAAQAEKFENPLQELRRRVLDALSPASDSRRLKCLGFDPGKNQIWNGGRWVDVVDLEPISILPKTLDVFAVDRVNKERLYALDQLNARLTEDAEAQERGVG